MPNICHELIIGASAETVYQAITSQEGLAAWWTPDAVAKPETGSVSRFPFGLDYFKAMKVTELLPLELVRWECLYGDQEWVGTTLSFQIYSGNKESLLKSHPEAAGQIQQQYDADEITLLKFSHDNWKEYSAMYAECSYTWGQFLRSLKLMCETGKGRPWPNQHGINL